MENEDKKPIQPASVPEPASEPIEPVVFTASDWLAAALGIALAALWLNVFSLRKLIVIPGLGTAAFVLGALAAECVYLRGRLQPTKGGLFLAICTALLAVSCGLFGDYAVRAINLVLLAFLTPASALALAGRDFPVLEPRMVPETLRLFFPNLFLHFLKPFQALRRRRHSFAAFWIVVLTLVIAFPVLALIVSLLSSADQVFSGLLGSVGDALLSFADRGRFLWTWLEAAVLGLMFFSFLWSLARPVPERESAAPAGPIEIPCLPCAAILVVMDLIYAVFAAIQFIFLFGGAQTVSMQGGYAQYARQGFFQLVAVAGINLLAAFACVKAAGRGKKAVQWLVWVLIGLTGVILASALTRMCLYIGVYGLSLLRCMTLVIMLWIAVALAAAAYKTARPDRRVFPVLVFSFLVLWLIFSFCDIDRRIADYNRAAYDRGAISDYDGDYIAGLAPGAGEMEDLPWSDRVLFPME